MANIYFIKKMLVVGSILLLLCTSTVHGEKNTPLQKMQSPVLGNETYTPYLEIVLENETIQFTPTDDTYVANYDPSEINGDLEMLATRNRYGGGSDIWECDILIKFDLSSIPPSTPIISASLNLYYYEYGDSNPYGRPLTVYKITSDWQEMSVNYNTKPSTAINISASMIVPGSIGVWMSWDLTTDTQQCINDPGNTFGWEIRDETYWGGFNVPVAYFYPKEYVYHPPVPPFIPYLEVVFADGKKTMNPTDDTYIANYDPSEINGDLEMLATRNRYGAGSDIWECDILIKFDLSSIPPSTPIISAWLNLYYYEYGDTNPRGRPLTVYRITSNWDEDRVNYNGQPTRVTIPSDSKKVPNSVGVGMSWNVTQDTQLYIDNPDINFGWEIRDETYWGRYYVPVAYFYPKEYGAVNFIPSIIFGRIRNMALNDNVITFEAVKTGFISFSPFSFFVYSGNEKITIERERIGMIGERFIFSFCKLLPI